MNAHVLEFNIDLLDLSIAQREWLSIDQVLDNRYLIDKVLISLVFLSDNDLVKILIEKVIINEWHTSLTWLQVQNSAAYFEKISLDMILLWEGVWLDSQVILWILDMLLEHGVSLVTFLKTWFF